MRRVAAVAVVATLVAVPAAEAAKPPRGAALKCVVAAKAKSRTKPCRRLTGTPARAPVAVSMVDGLLAPPPVAAPPASPQPVVEAPVAAPPVARLGVVAREWSLVLSRTTLPAGAALIELQNRGEDAHNLRIERADGAGVDVPLAEPGEVKSAAATLTAGDYRLFCALPGHDAAGMHAALTVSP